MFLLLVSYVCDYCDGDGPTDRYSGYIVLQPERVGTGSPFYVFRSLTDAAIWRSAAGLQHCELREVYSLSPFEWTQSRGTIKSILLAAEPFEIFEDHRFEPGSNRAFLAPVARPKVA